MFPKFLQKTLEIKTVCSRIQNELSKISSLSIHWQQTYTEDHVHKTIHNNLRENKITRDKHTMGIKYLDDENSTFLKKERH